MYDRMYLTRSWKLELVSHWTYLLRYEIRSEILEAQFLIGSPLNRLLDIGLEFDIDPVTHLKGPLPPVLVGLVFHPVLGSLQVLLDVFQHNLSLLQPLIQVRNYASIIYCNSEMPWFVAIESLEWSETMSGVICGVIPKLSQGYPLRPFGWTRLNHAS